MKCFRYRNTIYKHKDAVFRYACALTGSEDDAADITQDVLVKLWTHWDTVDLQTVRNWLLKVTKHASIDHMRKRRETVFSQMGETGSDRSADDWSGESETPEDLVVSHDLADKVMTVIRSLPDPLRDVMVLREILGYSYRDIARIQAVPVNTVRGHLHRGRKAVCRHLVETGILQSTFPAAAAGSGGLHRHAMSACGIRFKEIQG